jgi:hypothetical protein
LETDPLTPGAAPAPSITSTNAHQWAPAGALTTVFTPTDPYCATGPLRYLTDSCMPPNFGKYFGAEGLVYYSPGVCPSGYTSACDRPGAPFSAGPPLLPSETAIICCPRFVHSESQINPLLENQLIVNFFTASMYAVPFYTFAPRTSLVLQQSHS